MFSRCNCNAKWAFIIDIGTDPTTGKRKQKKKSGFKTKREAQAAASLLLSEIHNETYIEEKNTTFEEFANQWLTIYESSGRVKESTIRVRKHEVSKMLAYFAKIKLKDITRKNYQDALQNLFNRGFAENTVDGVHRTGRMIFKKAVELEILKNDPTLFSQVPRKPKSIEQIEGNENLPKYLEKYDLKLFLETAKNFGLEQDYTIFIVLSYTGIRAGELCALKWSDVDFIQQTLSITKTYYNPTNNQKKYKLLPPKTKTSIRKIDIDVTVINVLKRHLLYQKNEMMRHRDIFHGEDFIFTSIESAPGYPFYIKKIENRMRRLINIAQLNNKLTPHSLRHTHTSLLAEAGVGLEQIMERLGHKDEDTTKNVYLHVTKDMKKEASLKFKKLMEDL